MGNKSIFTILKLVLVLWFTINNTNAQDLIPTVESIEHNGTKRACWVAHVDPETKTLKKAWKDFLQDNYNFKINGIGFLANKDLLEAEQISLPVVSPDPVTFYTHIVEDDSGSEMKVFASDSRQIYFSRDYHPDKFDELKEMTVSFFKSYLPQYHQQKVNDTEKRIRELTKETELLQKDIEDNSEQIKELESEIEEMTELMELNQQNLEKANIKLQNRRAKLERKRSVLQKM